MDFLRVFGTQEVRYIQGLNATQKIRWYKAADGAKVFPHEHAFGFPVWDGDHYNPEPEIGTQGNRLKWSQGTNPGLTGQHFEGNAEWFLRGVPPAHANDGSLVCADRQEPAYLSLAISGEEFVMFSGVSVEGVATVVDAGNSTITFDAPLWDTEGYQNPADLFQLYPPSNGYYLINLRAEWDVPATTPNVYLLVSLASTSEALGEISNTTFDFPTGANQTQAFSTIIRTGEPLRLEATQQNDATIALNVRVFVSVTKLSALPPAPTIFFKDNFTAADLTNLNGRIPDVGPAWVVTNGAWDIMSDHGRCTSGASGGLAGIVAGDAGQANGLITSTIRLAATDVGGMIFRYTDNNNFWLLRVDRFSGALDIYTRIAGAYTLRAHGVIAMSAGVWYPFSTELDGDDVSCSFDGGAPITFTSTFNNTATRHGLFADEANESFDYFLMVSL